MEVRHATEQTGISDYPDIIGLGVQTEVCPITDAGVRRYINHDTMGALIRAGMDDVGTSLAIVTATRMTRHSLGDLEDLGVVSPELHIELYRHLVGHDLWRPAYLLERVGYYSRGADEPNKVIPVLPPNSRITGFCQAGNYMTVAANSAEALFRMDEDHEEWGELQRRIAMSRGPSDLVTINGGKVPPGTAFDPLVILPRVVSKGLRLKSIAHKPTRQPLTPNMASRIEQRERLRYRDRYLGQIGSLAWFLERADDPKWLYYPAARQSSWFEPFRRIAQALTRQPIDRETAKLFVRHVDDLGIMVNKALGKPSLHQRDYHPKGLAIAALALSGSCTYEAVDNVTAA